MREVSHVSLPNALSVRHFSVDGNLISDHTIPAFHVLFVLGHGAPLPTIQPQVFWWLSDLPHLRSGLVRSVGPLEFPEVGYFDA